MARITVNTHPPISPNNERFLRGLFLCPLMIKRLKRTERIRAALKKAGTPIGPNDLLIAAIAVSQNCILVSHNTKEFRRIAELDVEDWEEE